MNLRITAKLLARIFLLLTLLLYCVQTLPVIYIDDEYSGNDDNDDSSSSESMLVPGNGLEETNVLEQKKLVSKTGSYLTMNRMGLVFGTEDDSNPQVNFRMLPVKSTGHKGSPLALQYQPGLVRFQSVSTGLFIAMDKNGNLKGSANGKDDDTVFQENLCGNYFWYTNKQYDWFLSLRRFRKTKSLTENVCRRNALLFSKI